MSFEEFEEFQQQLEHAQREEEQKEKLKAKTNINDFGLSEVLEERQKHKDLLRERLKTQNFSEKEIDKLFGIISKAELEIEKIKANFDYTAKIRGSEIKFKNDIDFIREKMNKEFNLEFYKILYEKYKKKSK